jgi:tetrahydromethanopterin S-methyltransferase subunit G
MSNEDEAYIKLTLTQIHGMLTKRLDELDKRMEALESWKWKLIGGASVVGAMVAMLGNVVIERVFT